MSLALQMVPVIQASGTPKTKWRTIDQPKNSRLYGSKSAQALLPHIVACFKPDMTQLWANGLDWLRHRDFGISLPASDRIYDPVDLWVIKIRKPMKLCARSTSSEQSKKGRLCSENMRKVCSFYNQNNKIVRLSNMTDTFWEASRGAQRFVGFFFLDCAFRMLIGSAGRLR